MAYFSPPITTVRDLLHRLHNERDWAPSMVRVHGLNRHPDTLLRDLPADERAAYCVETYEDHGTWEGGTARLWDAETQEAAPDTFLVWARILANQGPGEWSIPIDDGDCATVGLYAVGDLVRRLADSTISTKRRPG